MRVRHQVLSLVLVLAVVCFGGVLPVCAQSTSSGTVVGAITDASNAVVIGATVTLTDTSTKASRSVTTHDARRSILLDLQPGFYDLTITKQGFATTKTQTTVKVGVAITVNMALQVGGGNTVVEVTAAGKEWQRNTETVG